MPKRKATIRDVVSERFLLKTVQEEVVAFDNQ